MSSSSSFRGGSAKSRGHSEETSKYGSLTCKCGVEARIRISQTKSNPGRPFYGCPNWKTNIGCNFFQWADTSDKVEIEGHEEAEGRAGELKMEEVIYNLKTLAVKNENRLFLIMCMNVVMLVLIFALLCKLWDVQQC